jgi:hypothetical protein
MMAMRTLPRLLRHLQAAHLARFLGDWGVHTLTIYNSLSVPCNRQKGAGSEHINILSAAPRPFYPPTNPGMGISLAKRITQGLQGAKKLEARNGTWRRLGRAPPIKLSWPMNAVPIYRELAATPANNGRNVWLCPILLNDRPSKRHPSGRMKQIH